MQWSMSPRPRAGLLAFLLTSTAVLAFPSLGHAQAASDAEPLVLDVVINDTALDITGDFTERDGELFAARQDLQTLGLQAGAGDGQVALHTIRGVSYRLDRRTQTLYITANYSALRPTAVQLRDDVRTPRDQLDTGFGAVANYDVVATHASNRTVAEAVLDTRVFTPVGVVSSGFVGTIGPVPGVRPLVRLDTIYSYSDPATMRQYRAGDFINGGLYWTRPVRMAGLQASTNFGIRPDLVTFPVPTIAGQVAVPSTVDVLVNGVQLLSRSVPAGPFEVPQLPVVTGVGDVSLVVRDATGQQTTQTLPVYASSQLLKPGLSAFSVEAGAVRLNYGVQSDDYGAPAGSASYRRGLTDWLTVEGHGEVSGGGHMPGVSTSAGGMFGGGAAFTIGALGVITLDAAGSSFGPRSGGLVSVGFERIAPVLSISGSVQAASKGFGDIASQFGDPVPRLQVRGNIGLSLGHYGSLGVAYVGSQRPASTLGLQNQQTATNTINEALGYVSLLPAARYSLLSGSYTKQLFDNRVTLYATAFHDFANAHSTGAMIGISIPIGTRGSVGMSASAGQGGGYGTVQSSQSVVNVGDVGWQAEADAGQLRRQMAIGEYKSPWGLIEGGVDRTNGQTALRGTAQGALAYADGSVFATNTIYDSFAVVDTDHTPGIGVLQENRPDRRNPIRRAICWCRICGRSRITGSGSTRRTCRWTPILGRSARWSGRRTGLAWWCISGCITARAR